MPARCTQLRQQLLHQKEARPQIHVQHLVPVRDRHRIDGAGFVRAGVVDEHMQLRLALRQLRRQLLRAFGIGEIGGQSEAQPVAGKLRCQVATCAASRPAM